MWDFTLTAPQALVVTNLHSRLSMGLSVSNGFFSYEEAKNQRDRLGLNQQLEHQCTPSLRLPLFRHCPDLLEGYLLYATKPEIQCGEFRALCKRAGGVEGVRRIEPPLLFRPSHTQQEASRGKWRFLKIPRCNRVNKLHHHSTMILLSSSRY